MEGREEKEVTDEHWEIQSWAKGRAHAGDWCSDCDCEGEGS